MDSEIWQVVSTWPFFSGKRIPALPRRDENDCNNNTALKTQCLFDNL